MVSFKRQCGATVSDVWSTVSLGLDDVVICGWVRVSAILLVAVSSVHNACCWQDDRRVGRQIFTMTDRTPMTTADAAEMWSWRQRLDVRTGASRASSQCDFWGSIIQCHFHVELSWSGQKRGCFNKNKTTFGSTPAWKYSDEELSA